MAQKPATRKIIILTLIALVGVVGYLVKTGKISLPGLWNGDDVTVRWNTYDQSGVQFKYPGDWEVLDNAENNSSTIDLSIRDKHYRGSVEWPGLKIDNIEIEGVPLGKAKNSKVFSAADAENSVAHVYFVENGKRFNASCALYLDPNVIDICNKVLDSFKTNSRVAEWRLYKNGEYGIEFSYPAEFGEVIARVEYSSGDGGDCKARGAMLVGNFSKKYFIRFGGVSQGYRECLGSGSSTFDIESFFVEGNKITLHTWYGQDFEGEIIDTIKTASGRFSYLFRYRTFGDVLATVVPVANNKLASLLFEFSSYDDVELLKTILASLRFTE